MSDDHRTIQIGPDDENRHVNVVVENGGSCTVNLEISNAYNTYTYNYPDWLNEDAVARIIDRIKGE